MKHSFKWLLSVLLCLMLVGGAFAQGLELAQPLRGGRTLTDDGSTEGNYTFSYSFPQFAAQTQTDQAINDYYQAVAQDMQSGMNIGMIDSAALDLEMGTSPALMELDYQIMLNDDLYLSVVQSARQVAGNTESDSVSATTFARDGLYAGQPINLSQVLGLEQEDDELTDVESTAEKLAYRLVWEIVKRDSENIEAEYLDGVSEDTLREAFDPESDFYMDSDENIVFFIQSGVIAGSIAGILTFPFAPAELLSAVKE
ncbi:MAG: hypothetical protein GX096_02030 [Clostridiales bacterium]|nr:hypothetical protein [Clostridiales bacterium]